MTNWYKLDVVANLFPSVTTSNNSSVFRLSAVMSDTVDCDLLQMAVDKIFSRYPMLFVRLKKGFFWNYFDTQSRRFKVAEEKNYPCAIINPSENNGYLLKVLYFGNRISVEVFHSLTDGVGASEFLKSLIYYYLCFKYGEFDPENRILLCDDNIKENMVDSFQGHFSNVLVDKTTNKEKQINSYRITGTSFPRYGHSIVTGVLEAKEVKAAAKSFEASVTAYIASLLIYSIYHAEQKYTKHKNPIVIAIPVNLRGHFPSKTLRNFFSVVNLSCTINQDKSLNELIGDVSRKLRRLTQKDVLTKIAVQNMSLTHNKFAKAIPLILKNIFVQLGFDLLGERKKTISLSNVGNILIPTGMEKHINHFEAILYPTKRSPINCGVISVNDKLTISFSKTIKENDIITHFFNSFSKDESLNLCVYSNRWEELDEQMS